MTIEEIQAAKRALTDNITQLIREFNTKSPLRVESVTIQNASYYQDDSCIDLCTELASVEVKLGEI